MKVDIEVRLVSLFAGTSTIDSMVLVPAFTCPSLFVARTSTYVARSATYVRAVMVGNIATTGEPTSIRKGPNNVVYSGDGVYQVRIICVVFSSTIMYLYYIPGNTYWTSKRSTAVRRIIVDWNSTNTDRIIDPRSIVDHLQQ